MNLVTIKCLKPCGRTKMWITRWIAATGEVKILMQAGSKMRAKCHLSITVTPLEAKIILRLARMSLFVAFCHKVRIISLRLTQHQVRTLIKKRCRDRLSMTKASISKPHNATRLKMIRSKRSRMRSVTTGTQRMCFCQNSSSIWV